MKKAYKCPGCDQPMKPKGVKKRPNEYDHAQGCPYSLRNQRKLAIHETRADEVSTRAGLPGTSRKPSLDEQERGSLMLGGHVK